MPLLVALESSFFRIGNSGDTFIKLAVMVEPRTLSTNRNNIALLVG